MLPIIAGIVTSLIQNNLPKVAQAVVDRGLDYVEDKLGVKLEPEMSPEKVAEIQAKAQEHEEFMTEQANANTADARDMQKVALQQEDSFSKRFVYYLAAFWSFVAAAFIFAATFGTVPPESVRLVDTILGFLLGTIIAQILNFFYGSSHSSKGKTDKMIELARDSSGK